MPEKSKSNPLKDFFLLHPFFTPARLKIVWWIFLAAWILLGLVPTVLAVIEVSRASVPLINSGGYLLADVALKVFYLVLMRIFFEIALASASKPAKRK